MKSLAAALLLIGVLRHYGWELVRPEWQAQVWNISASVVIVPLLWAVAYKWRPTVLIALWWTFEELQVMICSTWWLVRPWSVPKGEAQCSALIGFDLSSVGLAWVAAILLMSIVSSSNYLKKKRGP